MKSGKHGTSSGQDTVHRIEFRVPARVPDFGKVCNKQYKPVLTKSP
jgi:hypothetical protein